VWGKVGNLGTPFPPNNFIRNCEAFVSSFKGRYSYSVDEKGRMALPAKLRTNLAASVKGNFIITRGFERCLYVYPQDEWNKLEQFVRGLSFLDAQHRYYSRTLFERANDSKIDSQSRITIPPDLMQFAGIKNEVLILGVLERIEIWDPEVYKEYQKNHPDTYETVAEQVFKPQQ
jgi:MraZ protein